MFDALIREAAERFGLGDKARTFVGLLIGLIFNKGSGGFQGLQRRFAAAELDGLFASWVDATVADNVFQPDQFSAVIGNDEVTRIARRLGVPNAAVTIAGATLLPKLVGMLTRGGSLPDTPPAAAAALMGDEPAPLRSYPPVAKSGGIGWLKWLIPLLLIIAAVLLVRSCNKEDAVVAPPPAPAVVSPPAPPAAQANPRFTLETAGGKASVSGQVANEAEKTRLWDALVANFGQRNVSGDIGVDPATLPAGWMDKLIAALPELKSDGLKLGLDGDRLSIDTSGLSDDQRFALSDKLRGLFGGYQISGLWDRAAAALAGLKPGFSGDELVKALNLMNIYFDTGSATITADSQETLSAAATAISQASADTRIEVAGHTDNTGDAAANMALSQQRADAVAARLGELGVASGTLSAKGYGQDKPRADNSSEEGRAQNRRIEFSVLR